MQFNQIIAKDLVFVIHADLFLAPAPSFHKGF